jgi:hypothetical protein
MSFGKDLQLIFFTELANGKIEREQIKNVKKSIVRDF